MGHPADLLRLDRRRGNGAARRRAAASAPGGAGPVDPARRAPPPPRARWPAPTPKGPATVRRSAPRWAGTPSAAPQVGGERPDVGPLPAADRDPRLAQPVRAGRLERPERRGRGPPPGAAERSTASPARAASWSRRPPTRTAEYIGGSWSISPTKPRSAAASRSASRPAGSPRSTTCPSASSVSVAAPKATVASYPLSPSASQCWTFTASSAQTTSRPVAAGSSVPAWPALAAPSARRIRSTTAWLVGPAGLSTGGRRPDRPGRRLAAGRRSPPRPRFAGSLGGARRLAPSPRAGADRSGRRAPPTRRRRTGGGACSGASRARATSRWR